MANDQEHHFLPPFSPRNNLHIHPSDFNFSFDLNSSQTFFSPPTRLLHRTPPRVSPFDRLNSGINMFHQSQSQSQSQPHSVSNVIEESNLVPSDHSFEVQEANHGINFDVEFGSELGLGLFVENHDTTPNCNAAVHDDNFGDEFFVSESGAPEFFVGGVRVTDLGSDSDETLETEIVEVEDDNDSALEMDAVCDDESSIPLCWDSFRLEDVHIPVNPNANENIYINEDFEWEEVHNGNEEREVLSMFFEADDDDDDASVLPGIPPGGEQFQEIQEAFEWQVLSNVHNFEPTPPDLGDDDYNYTEYEMFFGQFGDTDLSSLGRPPASKSAVENLAKVAVIQEDVENNNTLCAVCKDEVGVGEMVTLLPCSHRYHGDCIVAWLGIRNTCPVCRYELPTDDADYELRKTERVI